MALAGDTRSFWLLQVGGWGFYGLATFLTFMTSVDAERWWGLFLFKAVARPLAGIGISSLLAIGYRVLDGDGRRGATIAVAAALASVVGGLAWYALSSLLIHPLNPAGAPLVAWPEDPHGLLEYVFVMLAWSAAFFGVRARQRSRERERRAMAAEAEATDARLRALTGQLNPHFLFNALSSLRGLVRREPERAERTITRLAVFLRGALVQPFRHEVQLGEEIEMIEAYLDVEGARLGDALETRVHVDDAAATALVPPFILQPLVENAVRHSGRDGNGRVRVVVQARIEEERLHVEVANPGELGHPGLPPPAGAGVGLSIVRERLAHYYPGRHVLELVEEKGWVRVRLEIPVRRHDGDEAP